MKRFWLVLLVILGIAAGGAYYSYWKILHHVVVIAQPTTAISEEAEKHEKTENQENQENQEKQEKQEKHKTISKGWINILVLGTDNYGDEVARSDVMMLIAANVDTHQVSVISIPRDTRVSIPGVGLTKINHANAIGELNGGIHEGTLESVKAVSNLLGVTINYYVKINFQGFQRVVDAVGGIEVNLLNSVNNDLQSIDLPTGEDHLSGDEALHLAQTRYGLLNGDFDRQQNQFYILSALANQLLSVSNISKLPEVLNIVHQELIDTNLSTTEMVAMGFAFKGIAKETIEYYQLPGQETSAHDPLVGANVYYYEPDMEGVREIVQEAMKI